ncbi:MAG: cytochrome b/b6 domain-containing protein [Gemmatimonadaceae bacterium]
MTAGSSGSTHAALGATGRESGSVYKRNHWVVRLTHWINAIALPLMVASGLRIFNAHPAFGRPGETFPLNPWEGHAIPAVLTLGGWLAGARHWHFAVMWILVINALIYLAFLYLHGEWRDLVPRRGDLRDSWEMVQFYLFLRRDHPRQGKHNTLQKLTYFAMPILGAVIVLSGIAIWKPVTLGFVTALFVNYKWARFVHFAAMVVLVLLALGHIVMVFAVDPYSLRAIFTGWYDARLSPERRNARPFYHLFVPRDANEHATEDQPS